jgi:tetratricopeptide (TPR) repeat protein
LSTVVEQHPLDERFRRLLMLVLYRSGQQAQALAVYRDAQSVLAEELGVDPGPLLQELNLQILRAEPVAATGLPAGLTGPPGGGPVPESEPARWPDAGPTGPLVAPDQLPPATAGFTGRVRELARLDALLGRRESTPTAVVCLHGMAGVGKTTLAVHWAHQAAGRLPDGTVYLDLRGFDSSPAAVAVDEALPALLEKLGVQRIPEGTTARVRLYRSLVTGRRMLILLDNARDAEQVRAVLPGVPGVFVLITSRIQLTSLIVREQAQALGLDVLGEHEARTMVRARLGAGRADPEADLTRIVAFCGGLPLALTLVAAGGALRPALPLVTALGGQGDTLDVLSDPDLTIDVRAVFSWSYRNLGPEAARTFRLMSVHPGPRLSLSAVVSLADRPLRTVRAALGELVVANLVQQVAPDRFALHDLLRAYAGELCSSEDGGPARTAALLRIVQHYLQASPARSWLVLERRTLVTLIDHALEAGLDPQVGQLVAVLSDDLQRHGHWHDEISIQSAALVAAQRLRDRRAQAGAHRSLGHGYARVHEREPALENLNQALNLFLALGDPPAQARTLRFLSFLDAEFGAYEAALRWGQRAERLSAECGDDIGQAAALNSCGWCQAHLGHQAEALELCRRAQHMFQQSGVRDREACAWDSLGFIHDRLGDRQEAWNCYRRAASLFREAGDGYNEAETLDRLGDSHLQAGDPVVAAQVWSQALHLLQAFGHPQAELVRAKLSPRPRTVATGSPSVDAAVHPPG